MGTSTSYVGSESKTWKRVRVAATSDADADVLAGAVLDAIANDDRQIDQNEPVGWEHPAAEESTSGGRADGDEDVPLRRARKVKPFVSGRPRQASAAVAQGGAALDVAFGYRNADGTLVEKYGLRLSLLQAMDPAERADAILSVVIGDGSTPDTGALRRALVGFVRQVCDSPEPPDARDTVVAFVARYVTQVAITEILHDRTVTNQQLTSIEQRLQRSLERACRRTELGRRSRIDDRQMARSTETLLRQARPLLRYELGREI